MIAKQGTMFIAQPDIPVPLAVELPVPGLGNQAQRAGRLGRRG
jgi:hypothetical protein